MSQSSLGDPSHELEVAPGKMAPVTMGAMLRQVGPGLIITAAIVGSGELIVTTKLGADVGFVLLWFIILGCLLKVFVQIELGRYARENARERGHEPREFTLVRALTRSCATISISQ